MDTQRLILFAAFMLVSMSLWQSWQLQVNPPPKSISPVSQQSAQDPATPEIPVTGNNDMPAVPASAEGGTPIAPSVAQKVNIGQRINVKTDVYDIEIDTTGGDIRRVALLNYPVDVNDDPSPVVLMDDKSGLFFIGQTGLLSADKNSPYAPDHNAIYRTEKMSYELGQQDELKVPMSWVSEDGQFTLIKTYTFYPGRYDISVQHQIINNSEGPWQGHLYRQLQRTNLEQQSMFIYTYTGAMISKEGDGFEKIDFEEMLDEDFSRANTGGWISMIQHYFLGAWIPPQNSKENYYTRVTHKNTNDPHYIMGTISAAQNVDPKGSITLNDTLFIGPNYNLRSMIWQPDLITPLITDFYP